MRLSSPLDACTRADIFVYLEYDNSSVGEEEHFEIRHIWETITDWQVYMHILIYMSIIAPRAYIQYCC